MTQNEFLKKVLEKTSELDGKVEQVKVVTEKVLAKFFPMLKEEVVNSGLPEEIQGSIVFAVASSIICCIFKEIKDPESFEAMWGAVDTAMRKYREKMKDA